MSIKTVNTENKVKTVAKDTVKAPTAPKAKTTVTAKQMATAIKTGEVVKPRKRRLAPPFDPFFSKKSVDETRDPLLKVLKLIFTHEGVCNEEFNAKHSDWYTSGNGKGSKSPIHTSLNNFRQVMIDKSNITWDYFVKILYSVMRLDIINVAVSIRDSNTKEVYTVKSTDTYDYQKKLCDDIKKKANVIQ